MQFLSSRIPSGKKNSETFNDQNDGETLTFEFTRLSTVKVTWQ